MYMEFHAAISPFRVMGTYIRHKDISIPQERPARSTEDTPVEIELARGDDDGRILMDWRKVVVVTDPPFHSAQDETRRTSHIYFLQK